MACPDCVSGAVHTGTTIGHESTIHSLPTYVVPAPSGSPKAIIVYITDAFGWELPNARILADKYAKALDATVYVPDFMQGGSAPHDMMQSMQIVTDAQASYYARISHGLYTLRHFIPWLINNREAVTGPVVYGFFSALRQSTELPIGAAGFCWGGKWTFNLAAGLVGPDRFGQPLIDVGFTAHPSPTKLTLPDDMERVRVPLSIAIGTDDFMLPMPQVRAIQALFKDREAREIVVYDEAKHGFAVRGDPGSEKAAKQGKEAAEQAVAFFRRYLTK